MNKKLILKRVLGILALPIITIPCLLIMIIVTFSRGKNVSENELVEFTNKTIDTYLPIICKFLNIDSIPAIYVQKIGNFTKNQSIVYRGVFDSRVLKFTDYDLVDTIEYTKNMKKHKTAYITLFVQNIYKFNGNHILLTKIIILNTLVHELTHYKQFLNNSDFKENYITPEQNMVAYKKQSVEIEANKNAIIFIFKNLFNILKFIIKN